MQGYWNEQNAPHAWRLMLFAVCPGLSMLLFSCLLNVLNCMKKEMACPTSYEESRRCLLVQTRRLFLVFNNLFDLFIRRCILPKISADTNFTLLFKDKSWTGKTQVLLDFCSVTHFPVLICADDAGI